MEIIIRYLTGLFLDTQLFFTTRTNFPWDLVFMSSVVGLFSFMGRRQ